MTVILRIELNSHLLFSRVVAGNKNRPIVFHACLERWQMDNKCPACGWITLSPGDLNTEAWSTTLLLGVRLGPSPSKTDIVKNPQEMQAGRNENRRNKAANRMDWRSVIETFKAGTRL